MRRNESNRNALLAAAALALAGLVVAAPAVAGSKSKAKLNTTSASPDPVKTKGKVDFKSRGGADGKFLVVVNKLAPSTSYDVVVDGVRVASVVTNKGGTAKALFMTRPKRGKQLLLGFNPRGAQVSIRNEDGEDVLEGEVPVPEVKPSDAGKVGCCVPDDGGEECEDRTPDACAAEGGTLTATGGCLPDPCAGVGDLNEDGEDDDEDEDEVLCCQPASDASTNDDPEVDCEDVSTSAECAAGGGVLLQVDSCDPDPCSPTPPADVSACCVPDDDGSGEIDCEVRTLDRCLSRGGTPVPGVAACAVDTCPGGD